MKRILPVFLLLAIFSLSSPSAIPTAAASNSAAVDGGYFGLPLCLPGATENSRCLMAGPAQTITEMRAAGIPYPLPELPAVRPPAELGVMPVSIAKINLPEESPAPSYRSLEEAIAGVNPIPYVDPGRLRFVSFINSWRDEDGKAYVQLKNGNWIMASPAAYPRYQGLEFFENPEYDFGWVVHYEPIETRRGPSYSEPGTGLFYQRDDFFFVYDTVEAEGWVWYKIGLDEWVNSQFAKVVNVNPTPPEGVSVNRWIELNLFQQALMIYEDGQLVFATLVSTGREPFFTKPGLFQIYEMHELNTMRGSFEADRSDFYYLEDVPWTIYFHKNFAIHATYWDLNYGYPQSHGCVNLSPGDAQWVFQWAEEGDYVWVHDPSGNTPTDPSLYGAGAP